MQTRETFAFLAAAALALAAPARAGLRFERATGPEGADVTALSATSTDVWAATVRGAWRLTAGQWTHEGLGTRSLTSVAVAQGTVFVADGERVLRRTGEGAWVAETLPATTILPSLLASDGTTLYAAGIGVSRRSSGSWSALPSPGAGIVTAATFHQGSLFVGLSTGVVAQLTGSSWSVLATGFPFNEAVTALGSSGTTLHAGTRANLLSWNGGAWVADTAFGTHPVRAITGALGTLRVATADAGVLRRDGGAWASEAASLATKEARAFASSGSSLWLGTAGGPVYRLGGSSSWSPDGVGLDASVVTGLAFDTRPFTTCAGGGAGGLFAGARGAGLTVEFGPVDAACPTPPPSYDLPAGCGDVGAVTIAPSLSGADVLAATSCGPHLVGASGASQAATGLPAGAVVTALRTAQGTAMAGTDGDGVFRLLTSSWSADSNGLPATATVQTLGTAAGGTWASLVDGLFLRGGTGTWSGAGDGLPGGALVTAIGGADAAWIGLALGGTYRRDATGYWRRDAAGLNAAPVHALEPSEGRLYAAAGTSGVLVRRDGGWAAERAGLPEGADVRVLSSWSYDKGGSVTKTERRLYVGTAGHGVFRASTLPSVRTVPVVLDVVGGTGARFRTELTLGSRAAGTATVALTFTPAPRFGAPSIPPGTVTLALQPNREVRAEDALAFLRSLGMPLPEATSSSPIAGSLSLSATLASDPTAPGGRSGDVYAIARTYTTDALGGSYGLFYGGPTDLEAAEEEASVFGLRSVPNVSRSHVAFARLPGRGTGPLTLRVQVYAESGAPAPTPIDVPLEPGQWYQVDDVLLAAGLPQGSFGYARITRTSGTAAWTAYGVVNDARTSDGSFLPAFRPGGLAVSRRQLVPVVLDVYGDKGSHFTTELTLVNRSPVATPVDLTYRPAPGYGSATGVPFVTVSLAAGEQRTIPDTIEFLRQNGVQIPDPAVGGSQAGTLEVDFRYLDGVVDSGETVALARTSTPNPEISVGGSFGLFYPAVARGGGARKSAVVAALKQSASFRSNLAVVHAGGGQDLPITLSVELREASTGSGIGQPLGVTLQPGDWYQFSRVAELAGVTGDLDFYAVVTRTAGDDTFFAYGVVNDNVTSDGSFVEMIPSGSY